MMKSILRNSLFAAIVGFSLAGILASPNAQAQQIPNPLPTLIGCGSDVHRDAGMYWVTDGQAKMDDALRKAVTALGNENDPKTRKMLGAVFSKIFKADIGTPAWQTAKAMILNVAPHIINESVFQCDFTNKVAGCALLHPAAFTPTSRSKAILCKNTTENLEYMSGILLHESMHRWGGSDIDYIGELYCRSWQEKQPDTARLLRTADAYMLFINQIAQNGQPISWPCGMSFSIAQ